MVLKCPAPQRTRARRQARSHPQKPGSVLLPLLLPELDRQRRKDNEDAGFVKPTDADAEKKARDRPQGFVGRAHRASCQGIMSSNCKLACRCCVYSCASFMFSSIRTISAMSLQNLRGQSASSGVEAPNMMRYTCCVHHSKMCVGIANMVTLYHVVGLAGHQGDKLSHVVVV